MKPDDGGFRTFADVTHDRAAFNPFRMSDPPPKKRLSVQKPSPIPGRTNPKTDATNANGWVSDVASLGRLFNNSAWTRMGMKLCARLNPNHPDSHRHVLSIPMNLLVDKHDGRPTPVAPTAGEFCLAYILHKNKNKNKRPMAQSRRSITPSKTRILKKKKMPHPNIRAKEHDFDDQSRRTPKDCRSRSQQRRNKVDANTNLLHFFNHEPTSAPVLSNPPRRSSAAKGGGPPSKRKKQIKFGRSGVLLFNNSA